MRKIALASALIVAGGLTACAPEAESVREEAAMEDAAIDPGYEACAAEGCAAYSEDAAEGAAAEAASDANEYGEAAASPDDGPSKPPEEGPDL